MARVGEHAEAVWKSVRRMPLLEANFWSVGVDISPPKGEMSELANKLSLQRVEEITIQDHQQL